MNDFKVGMGDFGFFLMIAILGLAYAGDPDLMDAIIKYVQSITIQCIN
jgi:hypothetical protein